MAHLSNPTLYADLAYSIPELWDRDLRYGAARKSFWAKFTGAEGSGKPIIRKDDFTKNAGDTLHIDVLSPLKGAGVTGESQLQGNEEKLALSQFDLTPDVFRHAVAWNTKGQTLSFLDMPSTIRTAMKDWLARELDDRVWITAMPWSDSHMTVMYADNVADRASILTNTYLDVTDLTMAGMLLGRQGAMPFKVIQRSDGQEMPAYACVVDPIQAYRLRSDTKWEDLGKYALPRNESNPLLTNAIGMVRGMIVYEYQTLNGWQGSMLRPECKTVGAHSIGNTTLTVGADDGRDYTKFFPDDGELCLVDTTKTDVDAYTYTGKNSYQFTGVDSLTVAHAAGTPVELSVGADVEWSVARALCFGSEIVARGFAKYPYYIRQLEDYGFNKGIGMAAIEGTKVIENEDGDYPNMLIIESAGNDPHLTYA